MSETTYVTQLIRQFELIYSGPNWLGESLTDKIKNLSEDKMFFKPQKVVHSVAEIVSHIIEWRFEVIYRLKTHQKKIDMHDPIDWRSNEELIKIGVNSLKNKLSQSQQHIITYLNIQDDSSLEIEYDKESSLTHRDLIEGLLHHDIYHLGQIGIVIKLMKV